MAGSMPMSEPMGLAGPFYQNGQWHSYVYPQNGQSSAGQFTSTKSCSLFSPRQMQKLNEQIMAYNQSILNLQASMIDTGVWPCDSNAVPPRSLPPYTPIIPGFELLRMEVMENSLSPVLQQQNQQQQQKHPQQPQTSSDKNRSSMLFDSPSEIFEHIYVGTNQDASNLDELKKMGIRHWLGVDEDVKMDLFKHWDDAFEYLSKAKKEDSKVLVHCETGTSCSAALVIAYAMKAYDWDLSQALSHVKTRRSCIKPNRSLLLQLLNYQGTLELEKRENNRLKLLNRADCNTVKTLKSSGVVKELNKNTNAPIRYDVMDDDSDDSIIELPISRIASSTPQLNQQSSKTINQKQAEVGRHSEKLVSINESTEQEISSKQQLRMCTGDIQLNFRSSNGNLFKKNEAHRSKVMKNRNASYRQHKINGQKAFKINPKNLKKYVCDYKNCNKMYNFRQSLFVHKKPHHQPSERFICENCQKSFSNRTSLEEHRSCCNGVKGFKCENCQKVFVRKCNIVQHLKYCRSAHGSKHQQKYVCSIKGCDRVYNYRSSYYSHKLTHRRKSGDGFQCDHCKKLFFIRSSILAHLKRCQGGCESKNRKEYVCTHTGCGKIYHNHSSFYCHKKAHQRNLFTCQYCQRNRLHRTHQEKHERHCNGGKKFECDHCQRIFESRSAIISHLRGCKQNKDNNQKDID